MARKNTSIIKNNLKRFEKVVKDYNERVKKAYNEGNISDSSYKTLIIDKDRKDFYKHNIYTKKQFENFVSELKNANEQTLKPARNKVGFLETAFEVSRYEKKIYDKQLKKDSKLASTFGLDYSDIAVNVKQQDFNKVFNRLRRMDLQLDNRDRVFVDNFKNAYKKRFGKDLKVNITKDMIKELLKNPNFDLHNVSDPYLEDEDLREEIEKALKEAKENTQKKKTSKKNKKTRIRKKKLTRKQKKKIAKKNNKNRKVKKAKKSKKRKK